MIDYTATQAKTYNYILDVHGSVIGLADERGTVISYEYDAWGNLLNTPDETVLTGNGEKLAEANPFRYSSYQYDRESGYYYLKYRYYSPFTGRFMSMDPVVSYNRYLYCNNNPVNYVDLLGLFVIPIPIITGFIGMGVSLVSTAAVQLATTGQLEFKDLAAAAVSGFIGGALAPIIGTTYLGAMVAGAISGVVGQGVSNVLHGRDIEEGLVASALIGAAAGIIGGPYKKVPVRLGPGPETLMGQPSSLQGFYKSVVNERLFNNAVVNSTGLRSVMSAIYSNMVSYGAGKEAQQKNKRSLDLYPEYKVKQIFGDMYD